MLLVEIINVKIKDKLRSRFNSFSGVWDFICVGLFIIINMLIIIKGKINMLNIWDKICFLMGLKLNIGMISVII